MPCNTPPLSVAAAAGLLAVTALASVPPALAAEDNKPAAPPPAAATPAPAAQPEKKEENKEDEKDKLKPFAEVTKGYDKIDGLFTLYRKKTEIGGDSLLMEIPEAEISRMYLLQATASTGLTGTRPDIFQGEPLADVPFVIRAEDGGRRMVFFVPNLRTRSPLDPVMQRSLDVNYPGTILFSAPVKAREQSRKTVLIDVTDLFRGDPGEFSPRLGEGPGSYNIEREFTYLDSLKNLPENLVIRTAYRLNRQGNRNTGPSSVPFAVGYNVSALPDDNAYRPRISDERIGYFLTSFDDASDNENYSRNVSFIQRWRLEKADPSAPVSAPKKPIVWYIHKNVPVKYRDAIRAGLLMYNPAFEAVGIKDAIEVRQMPDDADWDLADVRYNMIRWTDGLPFAIALFRADPRTGEILNASIGFDGAFASGGAQTFDVQIDPQSFFASQFPKAEGQANEGATGFHRSHLTPSVLCKSDYLIGAAREAFFGQTAMSLLETPGTPFNKEEYVRQYITEVTAHELGHCLGLRHNFIASTQFSMAELKNADLIRKQGVTATVMDYTPFNLGALKQKNVPYYSPVVGNYDKWAISYGYTFIDAATPQAERPALAAIAARGNEQGHMYQSDGVVNAYDPNIALFDLSREPLEYVERRIQVSRHLLKTLDTRLPKKGQSYFEFTRSFYSLLNSHLGAVEFAARYVGGSHISNSRKGDAGEKLPLVPIDAAKQKRALRLITDTVFSESAFTISPRALKMLGANPNSSDNGGYEIDADARSYPVRDTLTNFQRRGIAALLSSTTQNRISNNEFRATNPEEALTLAGLHRTLNSAVWSELDRKGSVGAISPLRRDLQRAHLDRLIEMALGRDPGVPRDAVSLSWDELRTLRSKATKALPTADAEYTRPHLAECITRIDRAFKAAPVTND